MSFKLLATVSLHGQKNMKTLFLFMGLKNFCSIFWQDFPLAGPARIPGDDERLSSIGAAAQGPGPFRRGGRTRCTNMANPS